MPSRNRLKQYVPESIYHVYNRGVNKRRIFLDDEDYRVYLNLLKRHLSKEVQKDNRNREFTSLYKRLELLCFCLMPNHFHLLIYQEDEQSMKELMHLVTASYSTYFNKKYERRGPLFEDVYKASRIFDDTYLLHITRYIHLNPKSYSRWPYSSYQAYLGAYQANWLRPDRVTGLFNSTNEYERFVADYDDYQNSLDELKHDLANTI